MYRAFYGLTEHPFTKDIPAGRLYISHDHKSFMGCMEYFKAVKGFAVAYGRPGMGKTTSIRAFVTSLNPQLLKVVYLPLSSLTPMEFYRNLSMGLGIEPGYKKVDMFHRIQDHVINLQHQKNQTPLIILDEAQFLSSAILNELRMAFNFQVDSKNHAMVLLCGQSTLLNVLNLHIHEPLRQRIAAHHEFTGLRSDEVGEFLTAQLTHCGLKEPLFTLDAVEAIAGIAHGSPRTICSLAEKALLIGVQRKLKALGADVIRDAYEATAIFES